MSTSWSAPTGPVTRVSDEWRPDMIPVGAGSPPSKEVTKRPGPAPTGTGGPDPFGGLEGADRDAYVAITNTLKAYGLESLADDVLGFIQQGYSADTINVLLQNTDAYKKRFAANDARRQKGLPVLSPAEYLATERAYRQVMSAAGLPVGFYDSPDDFQNWLANDVSPVEVQDRVRMASDMVNNTDPAAREVFGQWYSWGDMVAYALDRDRATTVLERQWRAAQIGGAAREQQVSLSRGLAERLAGAGVDAGQARQGFGAVSAVAANAGRLSQMYGGTYTEEDAVEEVFLNDAQVAKKRRGLASRERATFAGSSGVSSTSLSSRSAGQV